MATQQSFTVAFLAVLACHIARGCLVNTVCDVPLPIIVPGRVNPYNAAEWRVDCRLLGQSGETIMIPAFYFQNYTRRIVNGSESLVPASGPVMLLRWRPPSQGVWGVNITINGVQSSTTQIDVMESGKQNTFVRKDSNNQTFRTDTGDDFFLTGMNIDWADGGEGNATQFFDHAIPQLAKYGGNFFRLWTGPSTLKCFNPTTIHRQWYSYDQPSSFRVDWILRVAERSGVKLMLTIDSYNALCTEVKWICEWPTSVFNKANGGPLSKPEEYWTSNVTALERESRLRYYVARFAAYDSLFAWQLWNEVDGTLGDVFQRDTFDSYSIEYLRSLDPYNHLISNSYAQPEGDYAIDSEYVDFTTTHNYASRDYFQGNVIFNDGKEVLYRKPTYVGEFGCSNFTSDAEFTAGLWAGVASVGAGTSMSWWWEGLLWDTVKLNHLLQVSRFVNSVPAWGGVQWKEAKPRLVYINSSSPVPITGAGRVGWQGGEIGSGVAVFHSQTICNQAEPLRRRHRHSPSAPVTRSEVFQFPPSNIIFPWGGPQSMVNITFFAEETVQSVIVRAGAHDVTVEVPKAVASAFAGNLALLFEKAK